MATLLSKPGQWVTVWGVTAAVPAIEQEYSLPKQQLVAIVALTSLSPTSLNQSIFYDCKANLCYGDLVML